MDKVDQFATSGKLLNITHESYGFSADLIETINVVRLILVGVITGLIVMCKGSRYSRFLNAHMLFYFPWPRLTTAHLIMLTVVYSA